MRKIMHPILFINIIISIAVIAVVFANHSHVAEAENMIVDPYIYKKVEQGGLVHKQSALSTQSHSQVIIASQLKRIADSLERIEVHLATGKYPAEAGDAKEK